MLASPTQVHQYLAIDVKDTFVKDDPKINVNVPIVIVNLSQFDVIFKLKTNQPNYLACLSNLSRIGPLQSHRVSLSITGDPKDVVIKLLITWCKVKPYQNGSNQQANDIKTLLGKLNDENVGRKIIAFKRQFIQAQDQTNIIHNLKDEINMNNKQQPQKSSKEEAQKQVYFQSNQAKQRQIMIKKLQQQNLHLRKQNSSLKSMVNNVPLSQRQQDLKSMEKIGAITQLIRGLMKPAGLMEVLAKIQKLSKEKISQDKNKKIENPLANTTYIPEQVSTLEDTFYEFGIKLLEKIKQKQQQTGKKH